MQLLVINLFLYNWRRIKTESLDVHPTEKAIVVNYELEASLVGDLGDTMLEESRDCQKMWDIEPLMSTFLSADVIRFV